MNDNRGSNEQLDLMSASPINDISPRELFAPPPGYSMDYGPEGEAHLRDYWRSVRNHLWLILSITAVMTAVAAIYMARQPDLFAARVRVQVDADTNPAVGAFKGNSVIVNNTYDDPTYINTQIQILSSASLLSRVVKTLDLEHNQGFLRPAGQSRSTWQSVLRMVGIRRNTPEPERPRTYERLTLTPAKGPATSADNLEEVNKLAPHVESLKRLLEVQQVKDTRLIEINFTHSNPEVAAKVVNTIAEVFVLVNLEKKTETNSTTGDFLQKRIAELQSDIRTGEEKLINYAKNNQILTLDAGQNTVVDRLVGLNKQLLEAENERKMAEAAYRVNQEPGAADAMAAANTKELEAKLDDLKQKRNQLLVANTEEWPEVKEVEKQIAGLQTQIQEAHSKATLTESKLIETRYHQALDRERALRKSFDEQRGTTLTQNEAAINYRIIQQEIETNKTLLDGLLQRTKENDVMMAGTPNNIRIVDFAIPQKRPVAPRRTMIVALSFLLSFGCAVGLAFFVEYLDDSVRSTEDVENFLHLPSVAVIPRIGTTKPKRTLAVAPRNGSLATNHGSNGGSGEVLLTDIDKRSPMAEAYRHLRTSILLSTAGRPPRTLLITSSVPSEGKTTTAVNTAISLAQTGARVLIIDADMRRPRLHSIFNLSHSSGLSSLLSREADEDEVSLAIQQDERSGLFILPAGPVPPNPAELIGSDQMLRLVSMVQSMFTYVVIDSLSVAAFTDGVLIATMVEGVLLVIHSGKSSRKVVARARKLLENVGARIIGVVLNKVEASGSHSYYYYNGYYQSYEAETPAGSQGIGA